MESSESVEVTGQAPDSAPFLDGLAREAKLDRGLLDQPGTTVVGRADRAGSNALACYWSGDHLLVWADPAVVDRAREAGVVDNDGRALSGPELTALVESAGFGLRAQVVNHLLAGQDLLVGRLATVPAAGPEYVQHHLRYDVPADRAAIRAFIDRSSTDDVEAAALDEFDDVEEQAISVLVPNEPMPTGSMPTEPMPTEPIVAYASACAWDWDASLADIGVLVAPEHRRRGLGSVVTADTVQRLLADGVVPLYRHEASNVGSRSVAHSLGFRPVAQLDYYQLSTDGHV